MDAAEDANIRIRIRLLVRSVYRIFRISDSEAGPKWRSQELLLEKKLSSSSTHHHNIT